jgi:radical SAM protein with 4Fe4S-binding SPASM domain
MGGDPIERENKLNYNITAGNSGLYDNPVDPIPCWALFTAGHIMSDGKVTACCFDSSGNWVVGDLKNQTFMESWNSDEFCKLRLAHLSNNIIGTKCEKCGLF